MPEHDCLPSQVSAAEFLTHMAEVSGLPPTTARTRAADTLRHAGLFEERYRAIGGYSTGMKQRVKLGQALVHDPAFVFLDEPTAGLDPLGARRCSRSSGRRTASSASACCSRRTSWRTSSAPAIASSCCRAGGWCTSGEVGQFTKETETVFIEVDTNRDALVAALERRGVVVTADGSGLTIEGPDESVYDHVRDALVEAQAPLRRMAPRRRALTELFERGRGAHDR